MKNGENSRFQRFSLQKVNFSRFLPNQRGGPLKSQIIANFQRRKSTENPEISEIAISLESYNPRILEFPSFFPRCPSRESGGGPGKTRISAALCILHSTSENLHCGVGIRDSALCIVHHGLSAFCAIRLCILHQRLRTLHSALSTRDSAHCTKVHR